MRSRGRTEPTAHCAPAPWTAIRWTGVHSSLDRIPFFVGVFPGVVGMTRLLVTGADVTAHEMAVDAGCSEY